MTGTDLAVRYPLPVAADLERLGALVASSAYFSDAQKAAQAAVKIMAGAELGIGPIASMRGIDIIKGEVSLAAGMVAALVRKSGSYDYSIQRWDSEACEIVFYRHGKALNPVSSFTMSDARTAGLGGSNYQKFPRNMLFARAMTNGARIHCPDVFVGSVYTADELGSEVVLDAVEAPVVGEDGSPVGGEERAPGAPEGESAGPSGAPPPAPRLDPITAGQHGYLKGLIRKAQADGLKGGMLRAVLNHEGLEDVEIREGWLDGLSKDQASKLIERFAAGVLPVGESQDIPNDLPQRVAEPDPGIGL